MTYRILSPGKLGYTCEAASFQEAMQTKIPLGRMPAVTPEMVQQSAIVSQMGIAPFIKALEMGAQVVLAGRACDVAIFAALKTPR